MTMTMGFILIAVLLVLAALAFVIPPLMRTPRSGSVDGRERLAVLADSLRELDAELESGTLDQGQYEEAKLELERAALEVGAIQEDRAASTARAGWGAALSLGIVLPLAAIFLYTALGQPAALSGAASVSEAEVAEMLDGLARRLEQGGGSAEEWLLLARSYSSLGRQQDSIAAYRELVKLTPDNADLLVEFANTLSIAHDRNLAGEPRQLIERALTIDPDNMNALALAGAAALQAGQREQAVDYWMHLQSLIPADSPDRPRIDALIARAQGKSPDASPGAAIHGTVTVSDALADRISPSDTLFIFARAEDGPPMPLAVVRQPAVDFPVEFTLDDSHAMAPGLQLSQFSSVNVVARISRHGSAESQPGDLEGHLDSVALGSRDLQLVIDHRVER